MASLRALLSSQNHVLRSIRLLVAVLHTLGIATGNMVPCHCANFLHARLAYDLVCMELYSCALRNKTETMLITRQDNDSVEVHVMSVQTWPWLPSANCADNSFCSTPSRAAQKAAGTNRPT